jgi:hypothetical protein
MPPYTGTLPPSKVYATPNFGAPVVARALAIVHTCMYDAWAACDERAVGTQLGGAPRRPASERTLANKEQAINRSLFRERLRGGHSTMAVPGSGCRAGVAPSCLDPIK